MIVRVIEEHVIEDKRLGRHVEHDPRSRNYAFGVAVSLGSLTNILHKRLGGPFNQGNLGSCTGNATAGAINTYPIHTKNEALLEEQDAIDIYSAATHLDNIQGTYPPTDTGSSGLAAAKAAQQKGYIKSYKHAFSVEEALTALQIAPVICGIDWYEGFDNPNPDTGLIEIAGQVRGGHEVEAFGFTNAADISEALIHFWNSWGSDWGVGGKFSMTVKTFDTLMSSQGDTTILE